jgi:hypothetical protein
MDLGNRAQFPVHLPKFNNVGTCTCTFTKGEPGFPDYLLMEQLIYHKIDIGHMDLGNRAQFLVNLSK